ncbi:hypothetical protein HGI47_18310 [Novosphingobium sp. ERN07]|uniref:hypothetical protein n=1 Tax=Novosphingobium sp. ERN07 TaxID=2726187 RepID=UPI001456AE17|nr:hypothetical protein [Novosphingobium sp. ERN07]NLR72832.1 hypothetical protein [Novosphingobium sp. ERN07]
MNFEGPTEHIRRAIAAFWKRVAGWSGDQMKDAGAIVCFLMIKDLAHVAGVYEMMEGHITRQDFNF